MASLSRENRQQLERVIIQARREGEKGAVNALKSLAVDHHEPLGGMTIAQRDLRNRLRAHGRQLGDQLDKQRGTQGIRHLASECAYEHWHRMLFARFLAENNLLIEPESGVALSLDECRELAREKNTDWLELASSYAVKMLPQIFRMGDPVLEVALPPETRKHLEERLESLETEVFAAEDSLGWVYQYWQSDSNAQINESGERIGENELAAVTQFFTEDYMVFFLLHNTLGAWWTAKRHAEGKDPKLPGYEWTYLRLRDDGAPAAGSFEGWPRLARDLKVLDPCMGSGHFLVFALPILVGFRMVEEGITCGEAVGRVLRDNLFGLELDKRCTQIAAFNLALAAWRLLGCFCDLPQLNLACSGLGINAKREEWLALAGEDNAQVESTMERLFELFNLAPSIGSLIDPKRAAGALFASQFEEVRPTLLQALAKEHDDSTLELAVTAQGVVGAAHILTDEFTLVVTNVPYVGRGKQDDALKEYCAHFHSAAKADLATCFVERCLSFCHSKGTTALVTPQNWLFAHTFSTFRASLLTNAKWDFLARLGANAFQNMNWWAAITLLSIISRSKPDKGSTLAGLDVGHKKEQAEKAALLRKHPLRMMEQQSLLRNKDHVITFEDSTGQTLLSDRARSIEGLSTGDGDRFIMKFWEVNSSPLWEYFHVTPDESADFEGLSEVVLWEQGKGELASSSAARIQGHSAWTKRGVLVSKMNRLKCTLYFGLKHDKMGAAIIPKDPRDLPAIYAFCRSVDFHSAVRELSQTVFVATNTLTQVPFDLEYWSRIAAEIYPDGLPFPHSDDPRQYLFDGHPRLAKQALHVAVARNVGYLWPRQSGASFPDCSVLEGDELRKHADSDGIVCLIPVKGEAGAADRLRALMADAYGAEWSAAKLAEALSDVGCGGKKLEDWLRDRFFEQHSELFHQRPFVLHIWDGLKDGFGALVNYHKLAGPHGEGRRTLEKLIYTYLGDWIDRQRADQRNGVEGSDSRLAAAEHLQKELKNILYGEPPYDLFVRWKPLYEQPIGWEPDINDGVRINIRPFITAKVLNGRGKSACILRSTPKIKWDKDRGKEPQRVKEDFPWLWTWNGTDDFSGGCEFDGNRWNDLHYSNKTKREARERHENKQKGKGAGK